MGNQLLRRKKRSATAPQIRSLLSEDQGVEQTSLQPGVVGAGEDVLFVRVYAAEVRVFPVSVRSAG